MMDLRISFCHLESTPALEDRIKEKARHLIKYFGDEEFRVHWVCSVDGGGHKSEITVHGPHQHYHAHACTDDLYKTLDVGLQKIERQLHKKSSQKKTALHSPHKKAREFITQSI